MPTIAISSDKSSLIANEVAIITFVLSEPSTDFLVEDIDVTGGLLGTFTGSDANYTAIFTPTVSSIADGVISVASEKFSNSIAEFNTDGADPDNTVTITVDTILPTIIVSTGTSNLLSEEIAVITFTLSKESTDFTIGKITHSGGTLSDFGGSGTSYTVTFAPALESTVNGVISVASNKFSDSVGNFNIDGSDSDNTVIITVNTITPTISITSLTTSLVVGQIATITFILSEASIDFSSLDVFHQGGILANFYESDLHTYTATFIPNEDSNTPGVISVSSHEFHNATGNFNITGDILNIAINTKVDGYTNGYNIPYSNGLHSINIPYSPLGEGEDTSTSLTLVSKGHVNYGVSVHTNFLHLLEHFASGTEPLNPTVGQIWFDTITDKLYVYDVHLRWVKVSNKPGATGKDDDMVFVENARVVTGTYTLSEGKSAFSVGPITINPYVTVTIPAGQRWVIF